MSCSLLLPPHCNDITLYSIVGLIARLNGHENARTTSQLLFGSPFSGLRHDFPSNLAHFCQVTEQCYGDVAFVANNFTILPYFLRFRDSPSNPEAVGLMSSNEAERLKFFLGLPASPVGALLPLRHCPECALIDQKENGFAYWHREHQLPSSLVCPCHNVPLLQSGIRRDGTGWSCLHLPLDERDHGSGPTPLVVAPPPLLRQLATLGSQALRDDASSIDPQSLRYAYLHGLKQNGLLTLTGKIRAIELIDRLEKAYRPIAGLSPFNRIATPNTIEGLLKLVRKPRGPSNPISHLLLINLLFGSWELFRNVLSWEIEISAPPPPETIHPASAISEPCPPELLSKQLASISCRVSVGDCSLTKACQDENVDIGTATRWLGKLGWLNLPKRPKKLTQGLRSKVSAMLDQGLPLIHIERELSLSKSTIDRLCSEAPEQLQRWKAANHRWKRAKYRQAFLNALGSRTQLTRKDAQKLEGAGYSWLYRHDRIWLSAYLSSSPVVLRRKPTHRRERVNWLARDEECSRAIASLGQRIHLESWERKKVQAILRRLPKLSFSPRLDRLPKSKAAITDLLTALNRAPICHHSERVL
ncbi:hypothetical protein PROAA_910009 [Candidatus Propionivibrio aalborgensis]|uniref:Uncharacterized protein n=1 Tax=Candidatus Propionivibrio aalborgensis TaxID=1860101 RepID=A0A1A8Y436_9RHOO|nr:hypothetical protein PROAA_910009 [Candidatus Propionivibrio aalborgensis]